ncbi:MAG: site-2 protease family protein [Planctomycetes bacterium]|jgi:Zn-dependent protease|nr:site-2 protease family protein [Planctomycetota bacterium]
MSLNLKIARIQGIDVSIHWTFWLLPLWVILTWSGGGIFPLWMYLLMIAALFGCIVLHEFGHALTAREFGIRTRSITLSPLGGIAELERMSHKPWEEFWIAVAGPAVNVVIAAFLGAILFVSATLLPALVETLPWQFLGMLALLNVIMVVFNMIPAFPMDGGRVFRAILASWLGLLSGTRVAVMVGTVLAVLMGLAGILLLHNPWLILIALFVAFAGQQELQGLEWQERQRLASNDEDAGPLVSGPQPVMHITLRLWDPVRRVWVQRTFAQPTDRHDSRA